MARRLALLIGNGQFDDSENFQPLPATANDVSDMAKVLREHGDFEILDTLIDADSRTISHAIEDLYASAERGDLTLLYYSGHGYHRPPAKLSLAARDTNINRIVSTAIHDATIRELIDESRSKHRVIILDCCYSGAYIEGQKSAAEPVSFETLSGEATIVMTSSGRTQRSFALPGEQNSMFTRYLLEGIETGQADRAREGFIYPDDLFGYSDLRVRQQRPDQTPVIINKVRGVKLFLTRNPKISEAVRLLPSEILELLKDNAIFKRLAGVLELAELAKSTDQQLAKVAMAELEKMLDDDSRRVSSLAQEQLDKLHPNTPVRTETKPTSTLSPIPSEQAGLAVAKPAWTSDIGKDGYGVYADWVFKGVTQRFRWIAPGEFLMGSPEDEPERRDNETQRLVRLTEGYWLADTACTQAL